MRAMHDEPVRSIFDAISDANNNSEMRIATVIRGACKGEKALVSDGTPEWCSSPGGFLAQHVREVAEGSGSGIYSIDGEDVFIELLGNEKQAVICGAGHVSMPIITLTRMLGMHVTVIDDREEFIENARRHGANRLICKTFDEGMAEIEGSADTFFVIVTRGHLYDTACVGGALLKKHAYVGMIGSRRHAQFVKEKLLGEGISQELIDSIYTPIGLDIGAETPEEIAVAISAELIEVKNRKRRNFGFTKDVMKAITDGERGPAVLATIISRAGSAPRTVGSKMLIKSDGSITGTIGGGAAEAQVMEHSKELLRSGFTGIELKHLDMAFSADEDGPVCGGEIEVMLETV